MGHNTVPAPTRWIAASQMAAIASQCIPLSDVRFCTDIFTPMGEIRIPFDFVFQGQQVAWSICRKTASKTGRYGPKETIETILVWNQKTYRKPGDDFGTAQSLFKQALTDWVQTSRVALARTPRTGQPSASNRPLPRSHGRLGNGQETQLQLQ